MAKSPIIKTKRMMIMPFREKHLTDRYIGWLNDPEVVRFSEQRYRKHTLKTCRQHYKIFVDTPNYYWALEEIKEGLGHIGNITAYVNLPNKLADVGILIGEKKAWGKGYGFEAFNAVCNYLLQEFKLRKVTAGTMATNVPMIKIMKRMNMIEDGRRISHYICGGEYVDLIYMALYSEQYKKGGR